jgi:hypothetical protein
MLERSVLEAFERQLRDLDVPVVRYLRPGRSEAELDRAQAQLGFDLPEEVRVWFGWHDGVDLAEWPPEQTLGGLQLLTLDQAIASGETNRGIALESVDGDDAEADEMWKSTWLTLGVPGYAMEVALDCGGDVDTAVPVYVVDWLGAEQPIAAKRASMKELVQGWSDGLERGSWKWNREERNWDVRVTAALNRDAIGLLGGS